MKSVKFGILLLSLLCSTVYIQQDPLACHLATFSDVDHLGANTYIDRSLNPLYAPSVLAHLRQGKIRIESTFGITGAEPTIIVTNQLNDIIADHGGKVSTSILSPFGQCIIINSQGINTDIFAHELIHAELVHRLGYAVNTMQIPAWFSEGLSLTVDFRAPFRRANMVVSDDQIHQVKDYFYTEQFSAHTDAVGISQAAKVAVDRILSRTKPNTLYRRLERIRGGDSFDQMFL